jgi:ATP-dependent DNA helicase RecQ
MSPIQTLLQQHFGFSSFRPGQEAVIEHLLAGKSAAAVFPTGSGKSLCYQLPALQLPGITLVVSPLIALMKDQIDALTKRGIGAARIDSTLGLEAYREVFDRLRSGELRLLFVAPERFSNERFREAIAGQRISLLAVDEAHCISEWGHNFRPDYLKLAQYARQFRAERVLALTATATEAVLKDICRVFDIEPGCAVRTGFHRPNLELVTTPVTVHERDSLLLSRLKEQPPGPAIVYVTLQKTAEQVATRLTSAGIKARAYHAGMKSEERAEVQDWFLAGKQAVVVATIAFGMGIDKADIRAVYHYNLPKSLENYSQEIGRAGRDGQPAHCEMFACRDDLNVLENFVRGDTPDSESVSGMVAEVLGDKRSSVNNDEPLELNLYDLSHRHDMKEIVARTLLTYLELDGYLAAGTPFYSEYKFAPKVSSAEMLKRFDAPRQQFLKTVFQHATKRQKWFTLDLGAAARATDSPRERIVRALDYLAEQNLLEVEASGVRHRYQRLKPATDQRELAARLHQRMVERERADLARLAEVLDLVEGTGCQVARLCSHFAETLKSDCGHCTWCQGARELQAAGGRTAAIDPKVWAQAVAFRGQEVKLRPARSFARFLCGITSPQLSRAKLSSKELFGVFAEVPFGEMLARAEDLGGG